MTGRSNNGMPVGDGSWELRVLITDLQVERILRVKGELHLGGVMIHLVNELDIAMDWSDHAIWYPEKNIWLNRTRWTLDQYDITADAFVHFTPMHKAVRIQLPDLRYIDCSLDFSVKTFQALKQLCNDLELRHYEELSLCQPIDSDHLKFNYGDYKLAEEKKRRINLRPNGHQYHSTSDLGTSVDRPDTNTFIAHSATLGRKISSGSLSGTSPSRFQSLSRNGTLQHSRRKSDVHSPNSAHGTLRRNGNYTPYSNGNGSFTSTGSDWSLTISPPPSEEARYSIIRPRNLAERARMNVAWLDSSLSLMEQGIRDFDTILLRYKFYAFYDLNPKLDPVRINLIYEQIKWQILNETIDCTEEEMMLFAALQLQVGLQANVPQPKDEEEEENDDIDAALSDLQITLEGGSDVIDSDHGFQDIGQLPSLSGYLKYLRPRRKFTLKGYKEMFFVLRELTLLAYRSKETSLESHRSNFSVNLKGCEVIPDVNISHKKYGIKLSVPSAEKMSDLWLKCDSEDEYATWIAACRMAAKGRTMADRGYNSEVKSILAFLSMQHPAASPVINPSTLDINIEDYVAPRFHKKLKSKLRHKMLEAHSNVKDLNLLEAKMNYIKAYQSLPDYGVTLFVVRFHGEKKDELLGVSYNRLMRMSLNSGDPIKTWRYNTIKAWNINWETKHMMIQLGDGKNVIFRCVSADCKVVHEFIGGYIFLSTRSKDSCQTLDVDLFHKLTGGWM